MRNVSVRTIIFSFTCLLLSTGLFAQKGNVQMILPYLQGELQVEHDQVMIDFDKESRVLRASFTMEGCQVVMVTYDSLSQTYKEQQNQHGLAGSIKSKGEIRFVSTLPPQLPAVGVTTRVRISGTVQYLEYERTLEDISCIIRRDQDRLKITLDFEAPLAALVVAEDGKNKVKVHADMDMAL